MDQWISLAIGVVVAAVVGVGGYWLGQVRLRAYLKKQEQWIDDLRKKAEAEGERLKKEKILEAQAEVQKRWDDLHGQIKQREQTLSQNESRLLQREERIEQKTDQLSRM